MFEELVDYCASIEYAIRVEVRKAAGMWFVSISHYGEEGEILRDGILRSLTGKGCTLDEAAENLMKQADRETIVFGAYAKNRCEIFFHHLI